MKKRKSIMVDLDDTIISFSEMFINQANAIISDGRYGITDRLTIDDFQCYDIETLFQSKFGDKCPNYDMMCKEVINEVFSNKNFYDNPIYTQESSKIFEFLQSNWEEYSIVMHTKASTYEMVDSKARLFKRDERFGIFDRVIFDVEFGEFDAKPINHIIIIDDAPHVINNYLENNKEGIVYMPLRPWNEQFKDNERVIIL